jgi:hypothetical protein
MTNDRNDDEIATFHDVQPSASAVRLDPRHHLILSALVPGCGAALTPAFRGEPTSARVRHPQLDQAETGTPHAFSIALDSPHP